MYYSSLIWVTLFASLHVNAENVTVDYFVNLINSRQSAWKAGKYFLGNSTIKSLTYSYAPVVFRKEPHVITKLCNLEGTHIPESFDARTQWPECSEVTGRVGHQGRCNSCWAFAATSVMSDRLCIQTKGKVKFQFSAEDLVSCCHFCDSGCAIGMPSKAWEYYTRFGIVSGGGYISFQGCKPYQELEYTYNKSSTCTKTCDNPDYNISYFDDKHFGSEYYMVNKTPECIQLEIMKNGPVQAIMVLYEDFPFYRQGVYFNTVGRKKNHHSVKILGWGVERGLPYWLAANSWGCQWGNLNGFFKIKRGHDECGIEQHVIAGNPRLDGGGINEKLNSTERRFFWIIVLAVSGILVLMVVLSLMFHEKMKNLVVKYLRFT